MLSNKSNYAVSEHEFTLFCAMVLNKERYGLSHNQAVELANAVNCEEKTLKVNQLTKPTRISCKNFISTFGCMGSPELVAALDSPPLSKRYKKRPPKIDTLRLNSIFSSSSMPKSEESSELITSVSPLTPSSGSAKLQNLT